MNKKKAKPTITFENNNYGNIKINPEFSNIFVNSLVQNFKEVCHWFEANRILNFSNPAKDIKTIVNDETEPHKHSKIKIFK